MEAAEWSMQHKPELPMLYSVSVTGEYASPAGPTKPPLMFAGIEWNLQ